MTAQGAPAAALWLAGPEGEFLGSGFHLGGGRVVSCAHVVAGQSAVTAHHSGAAHPARVMLLAPPERPPGAAVHPPPDLAVLAVPGLAGAPAVPLADRDVANGAAVLVHGFAENTLTREVGPESAQLTVAGPSGIGLRVQLGSIPFGLSGSMAIDGHGRVIGVVKATADSRTTMGGWLTPLSELLPLLGERPPAPEQPPSVTAMTCARLLAELPLLQDPPARLELIQMVNDRLDPGAGIKVPYHGHAFLHLRGIAAACLNHRDPTTALHALLEGAFALSGPHRALDDLGRLLHIDPEG
ncbi:trypsin-like peptidase domain-containing protein [Kitasatospora sp. NPDC059795]|uniref:trypsin-like peptidase domain-containing protein n=1 Tax=Kitasatospora sp. NPDC059795 TaxID=3346949 RepID=UPI0036662C2D